ncbi:hypothetical protein [Lactobacillus sp. ESL0228]|uniref:hypothetical protein n=1 Tax=Lactobacillus sp. ESL0228 TaxID=2069352 RepID=UPI001F3013D9|nr:hypothetical protein [Lactobacillus sp. ESL0228]
MSKLSKQDKITSYHLWHDYQISSTELSWCYQVRRSNIDYLLALIARQPGYQVALDLGLKSCGTLHIGCANTAKMVIISLITGEDDRTMTKSQQLIKQENHRLKQENEHLRQ